MKKKVLWVMVAWLAVAGTKAMAIDGVAIEGGNGDNTDMGRIAVQWDWKKPLYQGNGWNLGGYWDAGIGYWSNDKFPNRNKSITEIGLTPVFRVQGDGLTGAYGELGIGAHLLSETTIGDKTLSTAFQFGDHIGLGYRFGVKQAFDISYRYQHLSNGGIKKPNNGINFNQIRLQYHF
jgi:hypothetical protein